ncbi:MAG: class II fumarate hydratase [Acidobacteria bacterium]|nr:class II fumarate hydratase [Acidobacteriota bacterium]MDW7983788.1 class II fumarate hydratase [Acidobacteriota bacterium]
MSGSEYRTERDSMGEVRVPAWALWGAQTQRAVENFPISGYRIPTPVIRALALIKRYAAETNAELGLIDRTLADAIIQAAEEVYEGRWDDHFPLDVFQTGSGTSTNMNMNEVLANRANEILGHSRGNRYPVHPNDHVNRGQSSNDVIPSAIHVAVRTQLQEHLLPALEELAEALAAKAQEFADVVKIGRTHMQDAVPMTLGQEFSGYAAQVRKGIVRLRATFPHLEELALGGTAIGTGLNTHPAFSARTIAQIARRLGIPFRPAENFFEALASRDALIETTGALNTLAASLMKIANDLRLLSSGPRTAIGEIVLPALQPGSSIMPGKVNPVIPEMMTQVAAAVMGMHVAVTMGVQGSLLELNVMKPMMAYYTLESIRLLGNAGRVLTEKCVLGIQADRERCRELMEWSMALVTPLALRVGYDRAAEIAYRAYKERKTVRQVVVEMGLLTPSEADEVLRPDRLLGPSADVLPGTGG